MQALLLSPATRFLSPDSSSSLSPSTPPLPSLDFLSLDPDNQQGASDTPSHSSTTRSQSPQLIQSPTPTCAVELINKTPILPSTSTLPRVPSNLRYQYNHSQPLSLSQSNNAEPETSELNHSTESSIIITHDSSPPPHNASLQLIDFTIPPLTLSSDSPNTSSESNSSSQARGTFICNSFIVNSIHGAVGGVEREENEQLAAAVRAFKTPKTAGLFEGVQGDEEEGEGEEDEGEDKWRSKMGLGVKGKGKGLMSLFEPLLLEQEEKEKPKNLGTSLVSVFLSITILWVSERTDGSREMML